MADKYALLGPFFKLQIQLGEPSFRRLPVMVRDIAPGLVHGLDNHIERDFAGIGQKVRQTDRVDRTHRGDSVAFDARDLHQPADWVTGQAEMVLHRDFGGVLNLVELHAKELCQSGCRHADRKSVV